MLRGTTYESVKAVDIYDSKKGKRYRSAFTTGQINYLEKQFERCPYIGSATRKEVSNLLNIPERAIKIWFQNRRMKEKKELNNKEYNIDRLNNFTNDMEIAKDSLNNLHSSQSVNDRQCSLQSTTKHVDRTNCTNHYNDVTFAYQNKIDNLKKETIDNHIPYKYKSGNSANNTKQVVEKSFLSEPANLIKYNLDKGYNKNFVKYIELGKKNVIKGKSTPKTTLKAERSKDAMLNIPSALSQYQDLPQDLSARTLSNVMIPQNQQGNIHLSSAYIPFHTQDVCVSAGNVIWKPVSVLPGIPPNSIPVTVPERPNINQNNPQKCKCNCNCNSRNGMNYDQGLESQPQYVIAIPYNNSLNILR